MNFGLIFDFFIIEYYSRYSESSLIFLKISGSMFLTIMGENLVSRQQNINFPPFCKNRYPILVLFLGYFTSKTSIFFFGFLNAGTFGSSGGTLASSGGTLASSIGTLGSSSFILKITSLPCMALF